MPEISAKNFDFDEEQGFLVSMNDGRDAGDTLTKGVPAEMRAVEIGEAGNGVFSEYFYLAFGGFPDSQLKTGSARISGNIQDDADADVPEGTQLRIKLTNKQRDNVIWKSRWYDVDAEIEASNVENRPVLEFSSINNEVWGKEGRVITVELRNNRSTFTVDGSGNSSLQFPLVGAK